jgi:hypothetical protein
MQLAFDALSKISKRLLGNYLTTSLFARLFNKAPNEVATLRQCVRLPLLKRQTRKARKISATTSELERAAETLFLKYEGLLARIIGTEMSAKLVYSALVRASRNYRRFDFQLGVA